MILLYSGWFLLLAPVYCVNGAVWLNVGASAIAVTVWDGRTSIPWLGDDYVSISYQLLVYAEKTSQASPILAWHAVQVYYMSIKAFEGAATAVLRADYRSISKVSDCFRKGVSTNMTVS